MNVCEECKYYHDNCDAKFRCRLDLEKIRADVQNELSTGLYVDGFNDGYKALHKEFKDSFEELNKLMCEYFEKWDTRKELTELEKLALHIVTIGMQDLGAFIDKFKDTHEVGF